jgi:MYXO-CTERM domain-containing protein
MRTVVGRLALLALASTTTSSGNAATDIWAGNAPPLFFPRTLWTAPGNWASGTVPPDGSDLQFGTGFSSGPEVVVFGTRTLGGLTIDTTTPFTFVDSGGDSLTVTKFLTRTGASDGTQTFGVPVRLGNSQAWTLGGGGGLDFQGLVSGTTPGTRLVLLGGGSVSFSGGASLDALRIENAAATINASGYEFTDGLTAVSIGVPGGPASLTVQNGANVNAAGRGGYTQLSGSGTVPSTLTIQGNRTLWTNGFEMDIGLAGLAAVSVNSNGHLASASGGAFLLVVGAGPGGVGNLSIASGGVVIDSEGIISVDDTSAGSVTVSGAGSRWNNDSELHVGGSNSSGQEGGPAQLTIQNGGAVTAPRTNLWRADSMITIGGGSLVTGQLLERTPGAGASSIRLLSDPVAGDYALTLNDDAPGDNAVYGGSITGPGRLHKTGRATQTLAGNNEFAAATVDGGTLAITRSTQLGSLTIAGSGAAPTARVDVTGSLLVTAAVDGASTFDAANSALVEVRSLVAAAYHGGAWDRNGITTTDVKGHPELAVGYARLSEVGPVGAPTPRGTPVIPPQSIVIRTTLAGDANLNGVVDFNDLVKLAQNYNTTGRFWAQGDFNYDGNVDFNDLVKLAQNYSGAVPSEPIPGTPSEFANDLAAAFASVPEPEVLAVLGLGGLCLRRRRR